MKQPRCDRLWQAEAIEDGRLSDADSASFVRHAETCGACGRECAELSQLRTAAQELPTLSRAPLERRRLRNDVLRHANDLVVRAPTPWWPTARRAGLVSLVACVALASGLALVRDRAPAPPVAQVLGEPTFQIAPSPGGAWRVDERGPALRAALQRGTFALHVERLQPGQRFLVGLPDGELEVRGTRFVVEVDAVSTSRVSVSEGQVELRLHGQPGRLLAAGEAWAKSPGSLPPGAPTGEPVLAGVPAGTSPPPVAAAGPDSLSQYHREALDPAPRPAHATSVNPRAPGPASSPSGSVRSLPAPSAHPPDAAVPSALPAAEPPTAGAAFAAAMNAFSSGDLATAERLLLAFEQQHPRDGRVEDATFLRAVARSRRGDAAGAGAVARDYLRRFPRGLRRAEAERLGQ